MKRLTDPTFKYVDAYATDIRKTFARVRREERERQRAAALKVKDEAAPTARIVTLDRTRKAGS